MNLQSQGNIEGNKAIDPEETRRRRIENDLLEIELEERRVKLEILKKQNHLS
jgi:hypothetical protein